MANRMERVRPQTCPRINRPSMAQRWWPVFLAMPHMLGELSRQPDLGYFHGETWFGRTTIMVQYWRPLEQLLDYAKNPDAKHLPAWQAFNKAANANCSVGIWHETYAASSGSYENVYVNMPAFGLGKAGVLQPAVGRLQSARGKLGEDSSNTNASETGFQSMP